MTMKYITRSKSQKAWRLFIKRQHLHVLKYFSDRQYGDIETSKAAAIEARDQILEAAGKPLGSIRIYEIQQGTNLGIPHISAASFTSRYGKPHCNIVVKLGGRKNLMSAAFSVRKYGWEEAVYLATIKAEEFEKKLYGQNLVYQLKQEYDPYEDTRAACKAFLGDLWKD